MTFMDLSQNIRYWFIALGLLEMIMVSALFVIFMPERKRKGIHLFGVFIATITIANTIYMGYHHKYVANDHIAYLEIPLWLIILELIVSTVSIVMGIATVANLGKNAYSDFSIIIAMNNLPIALCISDKSGKVLLINRSMYKVARSLDMDYPEDMDDFWRELRAGHYGTDHHKLPPLKNDRPESITIARADGHIIRFDRESLFMFQDEYIQTTVCDVTKLYKLYDEVEMGNWTLMDKRVELKLLTEELINSNHEEEILNNKIKIHNEMGEMVLSTQFSLKNGDNIENYKNKAREWKLITERLFNVNRTKNIDVDNQIKELIETAEQIGCQVAISEEVDMDIFQEALVRQAFREAIINAVRHGDATRVEVFDLSDEKNYGIRIENDGTIPEDIKLSGGLGNLAGGLKGKGGSLVIDTGEAFAVMIKMPRM